MNYLSGRDAAEDVLSRTLYGEARGQSSEGIRAVAHVVLNRVEKKSWWGRSVVAVCLWPQQFSCWRYDDPNLVKMLVVGDGDKDFALCREIAQEVLSGNSDDPTQGSTHYLTRKAYEEHQTSAYRTPQRWSKGLTPTVTIGDHHFFNNVP